MRVGGDSVPRWFARRYHHANSDVAHALTRPSRSLPPRRATPDVVHAHAMGSARRAVKLCCRRLRHRDRSAGATRHRDRKQTHRRILLALLSRAERGERASRRSGGTAAELRAAAIAAARLSRRRERQRGAAISGAVSAARRRPPVERSDRANDDTQRARAIEHYAPRAPRASRRRGSGGRAPRRRERGGTTEPAPGAPAPRASSGAVSDARRRPPRERKRPR